MDNNPNEWAIAFHGFQDCSFVLPKIRNEGLRPGGRQAYVSEEDIGRN
jgi:hypothetical protein